MFPELVIGPPSSTLLAARDLGVRGQKVKGIATLFVPIHWDDTKQKCLPYT